jgi:hypothetical protein
MTIKTTTKEVQDVIAEALRTLTPKEEWVVKYHFGLCGKSVHTLSEISDVMDVPQESVQGILDAAIKKLHRLSLLPRFKGISDAIYKNATLSISAGNPLYAACAKVAAAAVIKELSMSELTK